MGDTAAMAAFSSGQAARASWADVLPRVLLAIGILVGAIVVVSIVLLAMRRRLSARERESAGAGLLESLRRMRQRGQISEEEYETARRRMVARITGEDPGPAPRTTPETLRAPEGYDLTGEPLPRAPDGERPDNG